MAVHRRARQGSASTDDVRDVLDAARARPTPRCSSSATVGVRVQSEDLKPREAGARSPPRSRSTRGSTPSQVSVTNVGPTWGDKVSSKALTALVVFFLVIAVYLTFRFEWRMALAAIIAVVHDIIITVGVYAITGFEVTPGDRRRVPHHPRVLPLRHRGRVRQGEGEPGASRHRRGRHVLDDGEPVAEPGADALDQHVVRGAAAGRVAAVRRHATSSAGWRCSDFALALFVGLLTGAYSSIFVATPILAWLKEREPKYRALRERAATDLAKAKVVAPVAPVVAGDARPTCPSTARTSTRGADDGDVDADVRRRGRAPAPQRRAERSRAASPRRRGGAPTRAGRQQRGARSGADASLTAG